jgi:hypothetical protein
VTLQGRIENALLPVTSFTAITPGLSSQIDALLTRSIAAYGRAFMLDGLFLFYLAMVVVLGYLFFPKRHGARLFSRRYWLVLIAGLAVIVVAEIAFRDPLLAFGPVQFIMFAAWMLIAAAILNSARDSSSRFSNGPRALTAGIVVLATLFGVEAGGGFTKIFAIVIDVTPDQRPLFWQQGMNEIAIGQNYVSGLLVVMTVALAVALRKGLSWSKDGAGAAKWIDLASAAATIGLVALPLVTLSKASTDASRALFVPVRDMHPASLRTGTEPSFYIDKGPALLGFYGTRMCTEITGKGWKGWSDCDGEQPVLASLAGGKECKPLIAASMGDPAKKALGPALCLTAIEAKIACEVQGKRLASPEEWDGALSKVAPLKTLADKDPAAPLARLEIGEWTMRMVHGNPVFEVKGGEAFADIPKALVPTAFSPRVGFRCAYRYGE